MTDNEMKLSEAEIIKALEWLEDIKGLCSSDDEYVYGQIIQDLIKCKDAEIEKLQTIIFKKEDLAQLLHKEHQETVDELQRTKAVLEEINDSIYPLPFATDFDVAIEEARCEAIKEFAQRLKEKSEYFWEEKESFVSEENIDNLVKEMTEEIK